MIPPKPTCIIQNKNQLFTTIKQIKCLRTHYRFGNKIVFLSGGSVVPGGSGSGRGLGVRHTGCLAGGLGLVGSGIHPYRSSSYRRIAVKHLNSTRQISTENSILLNYYSTTSAMQNVLTTLLSVSGVVGHRLNGGDSLHRATISSDSDGRLGYHRLIYLMNEHIQCT